MNAATKLTVAAALLLIVLMLCAPLVYSRARLRTLRSSQQPAAQDPCAALTDDQKSNLHERLYDWAFLDRYKKENAALAPAANRVVFLGDSITEGWGDGNPNHSVFFPGKPYVNRGISGQTTPQMLVRFRQDVVDLKPAAVIILAGINDIAGNTGPVTQEQITDNIRSMAEIARAEKIRVILCSVLPAIDFPWHRGLEPAPKVRALNQWIKDYAAQNHFVYVNYYDAMAAPDGAMRPGISSDGIHPVTAGYEIMAPLAEKGIAQALSKSN